MPSKVFTAWVEKHRIVDGDTVEVLLDLGYRVYHRVMVRLNGIDAPESNRTASKAAGMVATEAVNRWIERHAAKTPLRVESFKLDKYGRSVGDILAGEESLAEWLLGEGFAKPSGPDGKRHEWTAEELERITNGPR